MNKLNMQPPFLKKGDTVGIVTPASTVDKKAVEEATRILESWGLKVKTGKHALGRIHQFSGTDTQRMNDFNEMIKDESVKAIWCARGGYGCIRIAGGIQFKLLKEKPKWLIGFSDITIFHIILQDYYQMQSIHGMMPINLIDLKDSKPVNELKDVLFGKKPVYELKSNELNKEGTARGILTGGNLSLLYSLLGTKYDFDTRDKILFIEDIGEKYYHIDRMMQSLKLAGKLDHLKALVVGGMNEMTDSKHPFGRNPEEIIADIVSSYDYPLVFQFPAGHIDENYPLILGAEVIVQVENKNTTLQFI